MPCEGKARIGDRAAILPFDPPTALSGGSAGETMDSSQPCRWCRALVQQGSRFCAACGQVIVNAGSGESERRQLTLLFCDVVDSAALSERLDPEDLHDLLTAYRRVCQDAIGRYEGHISQFLGDGVMSYFGYPIAQEDDAV